MYKNILVPISFDEDRESDQAIEIAKYLADKGGKITLLHVMERVPSYATTYLPAGYIENSLAALKDLMAEMASKIPGGDSAVVTGHSGTTILEFAEEKGADLIVIASHRPGMADYFLGSTAHQVVRHAKCAVHVIR